MTETKIIGTRIPQVDARAKVEGATIYGVDIKLPRMLYAKVLRSPFPHARIVNISTQKAERVPGVRLIATGQNTPAVKFGAIRRDERFFAKDEVFYIGDEVAAVVAVDEDAAEEALELIEVEYEPLPAVFDPYDALKQDSPPVRLDLPNNVCHHIELNRGNIDEGFDSAVVIHEETFHLPHQYHAYIEPMASTAYWEKGRLTILAPTQTPRSNDDVLCQAFNLRKGGVRIIQTNLGGGFGGKTYMPIIIKSAILAKMANAPVKLVYEREEDFACALPRIPMSVKLRMGADANGVITAKDVTILADNGAYSYFAPVIVDTTSTRVDALYRFKNLHVIADLVYTNKIPTSAFRGFGNPQSHFAVESMMDILAEKLGIDPVEIRLRNATQVNDVSAFGWNIQSCGLTDTIKRAAKQIGWSEKRGKNRNKARGVGIACGIHVSGNRSIAPTGDGAYSQVRVNEDGTVRIATSEGDIGQGANTLYAMITAEQLGVPVETVTVDPLDTDVTSMGVGASASRVTVLGGNAVLAAAVAARKRLIEAAADKWKRKLSEISMENGLLINLRTEETMNIAEAATHYFGMTGGSRLMGEGFFRAEGVVVPDKEKYGNISLAYAFATHAAEVEVDTETGHVKVLKLVGVHDSGKVLNRSGIEGQVEGGLVQGMAYALLEEYRFNEGRLLNPNFTDYQIPTALDIPNLELSFVETEDPNGPYGGKSIGEIALVPTAPAIANAIYDAIGVRYTRLPITPERILEGIAKMRQEEGA